MPEPSIAIRVLLAIADPHVRQLLEELGTECVVVNDGPQAIRAAAEHAFDVVLLQLDPPGRAVETVRRLRTELPTRRTPILVFASEDAEPDSLDALDAYEAVELLDSPVAPRTLRARLRTFASLAAENEQVRRESEQLRLLVHGTLDYAIFLLDPDGRVVSWNPGAERLKGYVANEIAGRHFSTFYPADVVARGWPEHELRVAAVEGRFEDEGWRIRKDGSRFWANVVITALRDSQGRLQGYSKVTRDLSPRKQAEEAARRLAEERAAREAAEKHAAAQAEERERLQVTLSSIGDAVITTDRAGNVDLLSRVAESLTGWATAEATGRPLDEVFRIVNEDTRRPVEDPAARSLAEGVIVGLANHTLLIARDGTERPIDDSAAPIRDAAGNVIGSVLVFRDISARRRVERHRTVRIEATQALADAATSQEGVEAVLAALGRNLGWDVGALWSLDESASALTCCGTWHRPDAPAMGLVGDTLQRTFARGVGLPGRVWATRAPVWIPDVTADPFVRVETARADGIRSGFGCPIVVGDRFVGVIEFFTRREEPSATDLLELVSTLAGAVGQFLERRRAEDALREQTANAETLVRVGSRLATEVDLQRLVQVVTDESTRLCGAQFGAFFYNVVGDGAESYTLYTLSGVPREAFAGFPMPRNTDVFGPTFRGEGVVRSADITRDPRYGRNPPHRGMPEGHLPVRSYLAVPVVSRSGEVLGGLFYGHAETGVFTARHERLLTAFAAQSAVAIDNVRLYQRAQASADRLGLALSAAELGDWSWDASTDVVTLSERAAAIFGIPAGLRPTWTAMQELLHPEDRDRARAEVERVVAERALYDIEYRVLRPDGALVWVGALGRPSYTESGVIAGMFGVVRDVSEHRQLVQRLRDSEARFRSLMEQAPFSVQILDPDGRTVRVNRAWQELWGVTLDQLEGYNLRQDPQLEARGVKSSIERAFAGEPSLVPAIRYDPNETLPGRSRNEDPIRWVAAVAYPLKDDDGTVREVVLVHEDVTSRREAEAALRESEERLRLALDAGRMGVWDWNVRTGALRWSEHLEPLHGLAAGAFAGTFEHFRELVHEDDRATVDAAIGAAFEGRGEFQVEYRTRWPSGTVHWIAGSGRVFVGDDGAPRRMIGTGLDVSERKRAEQTARFLADASAALGGLVDLDSTLQKVAALAVPYFADWAAVDILEGEGRRLRRVAVAHVDPERVHLAHELHRRFPPDPSSPHGVWHILRTGKAELVPVIDPGMVERSGSTAEAVAILERLGLRSYLGVPLVVRNRTLGVLTFIAAESGHTYDDHDRALAEDLARRASIAIENAGLYQELRDADRRKDEFLATLAHELRNPLAPIRNGLAVLRLTPSETGPAGDVRAMMERQVAHLVRLVDDLLDVSRITRNRLEVRKQRVALSEVIDQAIDASRPAIEQATHSFSASLPATPVHLDADPVRLAQVFSNLLTNAARYTDPGGRIELGAEVDGRQVVVRVRDDGLGIPTDQLTRIFEPFAQVDRGSSQSQGGLGIGLMLVKRLVALHGGTVEARSDGPGHGSEFVVRLPLAVEAAASESERSPASNPRADLALRVLVVDDNQDAADSLRMVLELLGSDVHTASDGEEALAVAEATRPDVILLDIGLPGMSGHEVCRLLRQRPWASDRLIVALTGWGQEEDRRRSAEAGFDHHVVKPVDPKELARLLATGRRGA